MLDTRFLARNLTKDSTGYQRHLVENPFDGGGDALNGFDRYGRQGYLLDGGNAGSRAIFLGEIVEEGLSGPAGSRLGFGFIKPSTNGLAPAWPGRPRL